MPAELRTATFTGTVWGDPVLAETDGVTINTVSFAPGARTHWHSHDGGQVLVVTSGLGRVADRDGEGERDRRRRHRLHPAGGRALARRRPGQPMVHIAISISRATTGSSRSPTATTSAGS